MGQKYERYDHGVLVEAWDTRTVDEEKAEKLKLFKEKCEEQILKAAPYYKQLNVALGIAEKEDKTLVEDTIKDHTSTYKDLKTKVLLATTLDELDVIYWPPEEVEVHEIQ